MDVSIGGYDCSLKKIVFNNIKDEVQEDEEDHLIPISLETVGAVVICVAACQ